VDDDQTTRLKAVPEQKITLMVQFAPTATEPAQILVSIKSALLVPILTILSASDPMFVKVTLCGALAVPST